MTPLDNTINAISSEICDFADNEHYSQCIGENCNVYSAIIKKKLMTRILWNDNKIYRFLIEEIESSDMRDSIKNPVYIGG